MIEPDSDRLWRYQFHKSVIISLATTKALANCVNLVVVGDQSCGKLSLLEGFSGLLFLIQLSKKVMSSESIFHRNLQANRFDKAEFESIFSVSINAAWKRKFAA